MHGAHDSRSHSHPNAHKSPLGRATKGIYCLAIALTRVCCAILKSSWFETLLAYSEHAEIRLSAGRLAESLMVPNMHVPAVSPASACLRRADDAAAIVRLDTLWKCGVICSCECAGMRRIFNE